MFPLQVRADKLHWLCAAEDLYRLGLVPKDSLLGRALNFYRDQLAKEDRHHRSRDALTPFVNTPAEQNLRVQVALLDLWDKPELAARALFRYTHSSQARTISEALRSLVSAEYLDAKATDRDRAVTILPWRFDKLTPTARVQLQRLGLGQGAIGYQLRPVQLAPAARQKVAWAVCAGLALTAVVGTVSGLSTWLHPSEQQIVTEPHRPDGGIVTVEALPQSRDHQVSAQYAFVTESQRVPAGAQVLLTWQEEQRNPPDGGLDKRQDFGAEVATPLDLSDPEGLAHREDQRKPEERLGPAKPSQPPTGMTIVVAVQRDLGSIPSTPDLEIAKEWKCPYQEWIEPKSGMVFVAVCGGTFQMGSEPTDPEASYDEQPSHPVMLSDYWIGKYEVSNSQYRKYKPDHHGRFEGNDLPVESVKWDEARAYCQWVGGDLPTEAEWEYAARGPEGRKYPWGQEEPEPGRATFNRLFAEGPEAITANPRGQGPFGTMNQAGNVWEWVTDRYEAGRYGRRKAESDKSDPPSPISNPVDDRSACRRVLRGGSFFVEPKGLRSVVRFRYGPEDLNRNFGFRCVRGSGRQP